MFVGQDNLRDILRRTVEALDIPEEDYEQATIKYEDIGDWLSQEGSSLQRYSPQIYPQGSFRLGTVIRPITDDCEYDIDLVCLLQIQKENTTQERLKTLIGDRLKRRKDLADVLKESRRCWTLSYPRQFHLDVLPSLPNLEAQPTGILLSDRELHNWQKSNPIAYADWFYERMKLIFEQRRAEAARARNVNVEEVPRWAVKTPLQRSVQLMKRHRDIRFQHNQEHQPISIIITTLAAKIYLNQSDVLSALSAIIRTIDAELSSGKPKYIEKRNGKWWIQNPVDENENFADKWNEYPERAEAFIAWVKRLASDLDEAERGKSVGDIERKLSTVFGDRGRSRSIASFGSPSTQSSAGTRSTGLTIPTTSEISHCKRPEWPVSIRYTATVTGTAYFKKHGKKLWSVGERELPKGISLKFVVKTNVPWPYTVRWQVVNTGKEAHEANGLRGDFYLSDENTSVRWETTSYVGTHWIEAFVIKDGICVARSGRKYVRIR